MANINYEWNEALREDGQLLEGIYPNHKDILTEDALDRISEMVGQGFTSGELHSTLYDDDEMEIEYSGWWEFKD